ncbi:MAG: hypothetical protein M3Y42_09635 [Actinomycetota bacterium]|nr:hypothetical protein [Actinomycetota bacterium]
MTDTKTTVPDRPDRLSLSATQILASGLAAVSATVAASYFGVAGTVIGAALGSMISVVGSAVYSYSIRQTRHQERRTLDVAVSQRFPLDPHRADRIGQDPEETVQLARAETPAAVESARPAARRFSVNPRRLALVAGALFVTTLGVITGFELLSGQPLTATVHGNHGSGVSLGGGDTSKPAKPTVTSPSSSTPPASTNAPAPSTGSATPTVTVTLSPSGSASPSTSTSPSDGSSTSDPATTPTPTPTPTPSG